MKVKFEYVGIRVKDVRKSVDFYTKVLGMKVIGKSEIPAAKGEVVILQSEDGGFCTRAQPLQKGQ